MLKYDKQKAMGILSKYDIFNDWDIDFKDDNIGFEKEDNTEYDPYCIIIWFNDELEVSIHDLVAGLYFMYEFDKLVQELDKCKVSADEQQEQE